jgi:hypothetical protein
MECMLGYVSDTSIRVLPNFTNLWFNFTNEQLNHGRLSGSILSNASNAGTQTDLDRNIEKGWFIIPRVGESATAHLHEGLTLGFNTLNRTWLGETELELASLESEVSTSARLNLNELVKVTLESMQLEVLDLQNIGAAIIKETTIVGHNN